MNSIDNFQKELVFSIFSIAKSKNIVVFAFTLDSFDLFYDDFCVVYIALTAMKRLSDEAIKR
jgi:hypothetical protein